ncbi:type II toxin-antitoxin system VapC family toxin [bacterium]|jgi:PIN domain nuclease of toxin-antitoxin system|nr:type II toxin-antitoxin system VapC family toxin [bacterium]
MRAILDTHAFLWFITNDPKLSSTARVLIADPSNEILISPASYWEIAIKIKLGKYPISVPYLTLITEGIDNNGFKILPIEPKHTAKLTTLDLHHHDPFDRLMAAQAMVEGISMVSADVAFDLYSVPRIW